MSTVEDRSSTTAPHPLENFPAASALRPLFARRSSPSPQGRAPSDAELDLLLQAAATVPDHGAIRPWRFVVVTGPARERLGDALASDCAAARPEAPDAVVDKARRKAFAAPALIIVIASPDPGSNVPDWEQVASASCCGYAIVLAAQALGLGGVWKSTALRDGPNLRALCAADEHEELLGWINVGSHDHDEAYLRPPVDVSSLATVLPPSSSR